MIPPSMEVSTEWCDRHLKPVFAAIEEVSRVNLDLASSYCAAAVYALAEGLGRATGHTTGDVLRYLADRADETDAARGGA